MGKEEKEKGDFIDLLRIGKEDPKLLESILADKAKIAGYDITSAELVAIKNLDPDTIRVVVESLEDRIGVSPIADTNACAGGTNACSAQGRPEEIKGIVH